MGLHIHSLDNIPNEVDRDYFVYLLDYGWDGDSLSEALNKNYGKMANLAAQNRAVVIKGTSNHFSDDVFSWHSINGLRGEFVLPAILITNTVPSNFKNTAVDVKENKELYQENGDTKLILIPLKKFCKSADEVISMINQIFENISKGEDLSNFDILRRIKSSRKSRMFDAIILEPNFYGIGVNLKKLFQK